MKEGYKQTEIGVIPEDWEVYTLSDISIINPGSTQGLPKEFFYIDLESVTHGKLIEKKVIEKRNAPSRAQRRFMAGDILYQTVRPYQMNNLFINFDATKYIASTGYAVIRTNESIAARLLYQILHTDRFTSVVLDNCTGTGYPAINPKVLSSLKIAIPAKTSEQQHIAEALSDMDELIASLEKLVAKKKAIKQGVMQELLTGKRRLPGFSGEWNAVELRKLGRFVGGGTPSTNNLDWWKGKTPWISSSDLEENQIRTIKMSRYITEEAISHSATNLCPAGAILVVSRVGVGKVAVAPVDLCTSQDFTNIIVNNCNPFFLAYTLSIVMKEKAATTQGASIKGVTSDEIASIKVRIPSKLEQDAIVNALESIDQDIGSIEKQYLKFRQIKHGMMQQLLTGKIRL